MSKMAGHNQFEEVLIQKYVDLNQRTYAKGKGVVEAAADESSSNDDDVDDNPKDAVFEEARRMSLLENYQVEGDPSRTDATDAAITITTEPIEVLEEVHVEEELVDYEPSPVIDEVPYDPILSVVREYEEDEAIGKSIYEDIMAVINVCLPSFASAKQDVPTREVVQDRVVGEREVLQPDAEASREVD